MMFYSCAELGYDACPDSEPKQMTLFMQDSDPVEKPAEEPEEKLPIDPDEEDNEEETEDEDSSEESGGEETKES